ncbi:MAG: SDR family oxidoreductase [Clostridia bacterium]|nr:SDR family oxidoreductase [Clostridia bacterium]
METGINGRVVLVTAAGQGIGKAVAKVFGEEGAKLIINDAEESRARETVQELEAIGVESIAAPFDVSDFEQVMASVQMAKELVGPVDVLVNVAGISPKKDGQKVPLYEMAKTEWDRVVAVNLTGMFNCCRAVLPDMVRLRRGRIINVSSASARVYTAFTGAHYIATKAGVIGLTHALAGELAEFGINVNAIAPGRVRTAMLSMVPKEVNEEFLRNVPMRRFAEPEEIAYVALFLASDLASYITGATLDVNGGFYMN